MEEEIVSNAIAVAPRRSSRKKKSDV